MTSGLKTTNLEMIDPLNWDEEDVKLWLHLNDLDAFIPQIHQQYRLDGRKILSLQESQLSFLSTHPDYSRLLVRLQTLKSLYPPALTHVPAFNINDLAANYKRELYYASSPDEGSCPHEYYMGQGQLNPVNDEASFKDFPFASSDTLCQQGVQNNDSSIRKYKQPLHHQINDECTVSSHSKFSIQRLIMAVLILIVSFLFCCYMVVIADERTPPQSKYPPLPDIFIDSFERVEWAATASEAVIVVLSVVFIVVLLIRSDWTIVLKRWCLLTSSLYLLRGITMYSTALPVVGDHLNCLPKPINSTYSISRFNRVIRVLSSQGMQMYGSQMCGDYIYSGHTCMLVIFSHFITYYTPRRIWPLHALIWASSIFAVICIVAGHFHYTVDVILAAVLASRLFAYYHALCHCPCLFEPVTKKSLGLYIPVFYLFESVDTCRKEQRKQHRYRIPAPLLGCYNRIMSILTCQRHNYDRN